MPNTAKKNTRSRRKVAPKAAAPKVDRRRKMNFNLPAASKVKPPRENSKRAKVLEMLSRPKGATHEEVMDAINWDRITAYEGIRLLSIHNGYGLEEDDKGRIRAFEGKQATKKKERTKEEA